MRVTGTRGAPGHRDTRRVARIAAAAASQKDMLRAALQAYDCEPSEASWEAVLTALQTWTGTLDRARRDPALAHEGTARTDTSR